MGKKTVKIDKKDETNPKKEDTKPKKDETKTNKKKNKNDGIPILSICCSFISGLIVLTAACLSYRIYEIVSYVPDMPDIDLNAWWGPNNTKDVQDTSIRPYRIVFSEAMITDLRKRFDDYRRLKKTKTLEDAAWTYGVNYDAFGQFFSYWIFKYKFSERERFFNTYNHFKTNIQGLDIHYVHVKPRVEKNVKVFPLLLLHGWPGSFREFYGAIPSLTTVQPGHDFVFELIIPSLPGFGYSDAPVRSGLSAVTAGVVMRNLMKRLGFQNYYVQGGDFGFLVGSSISTMFPDEVLGFHTNLAMVMGKKTILVWLLGSLWPSFVEKDYADRLYPVTDRLSFYLEESGYMHLQSTKPDSIGVALNESPAGLAAYILEKFVSGANINNKYTEDGRLDERTYDDLLDNIMVYWATNSMPTSIRFYKERIINSGIEGAMNIIPTNVPVWALRLKHEIFFLPEFMIKWKFPNLQGTTTLDTGGHFAAFELPEVFANDVFKAVKSFVEFHKTG